ncbi:hypothetical protein RD110_15850 [Rhodoferax koreense]|uniref:Uncharacterized protein n=1 Tax=Rhodoferax koreensis TaxID=1842727 RepID=A0A1P8JXN8_9BURK|nr:hypothetical protein [Rhodoferax koreense]APW38495.1 hypothetical protein RD110_15850 [Rhodoferax koreense]
MKTAHRKQSKFKRDPRAMERAFGRVGPFLQAEVTNLLIPTRIAFEAFRTGQATVDDFATLVDTANITLVRSESVDQRCVEACDAATAALKRVQARQRATGRWGMDGPAFLELGVMIDLYDQFIANSSPQQMKAVLEEVHRREEKQRREEAAGATA